MTEDQMEKRIRRQRARQLLNPKTRDNLELAMAYYPEESCLECIHCHNTEAHQNFAYYCDVKKEEMDDFIQRCEAFDNGIRRK